MRIIFLNCWHGKIRNRLLNFIEENAPKTDIFVFLEVAPEIFPVFSEKLVNFYGSYVSNSAKSGQAIFICRNVQLVFTEKVDLYEQQPGDTGCLLKVKLKVGDLEFYVGDVHGKALPGDKLDTEIRLYQSRKILESFDVESLPRIIGGDFNLLPETESIKMFEKAGYVNLIKRFGIKSTRNRLAWEQAEKQEKEEGRKFFGKQYFADYVFVSPEVKVKNFSVPNLEISDHLPLILDFEI